MKNLFTNLKLKNTIKILFSFFFFLAFIANVNALTRPAINANTTTVNFPSLNVCGTLAPNISGNTAYVTNATWVHIGDPGVGNCNTVSYKWQYSTDGGASFTDINSFSTSNVNFPSSWTWTNTSGIMVTVSIQRVTYVSCSLPAFSEQETISDPIDFNVYPPFTAAITSQTNLTCYGNTNGAATVTITGGTPYFNYSWNTSPPQSNSLSLLYTNTATNLPAGTYLATVTDNYACNATATVTITQPNQISFSVSSSPVTCSANGSIGLTVSGGTGTYTYAWTKDGSAIGTNTSTLTNLGTGTYVATVTDANNCTASVTQYLSAPPSITISLGTHTNVSCFGLATGGISTSASGGSGTLTYSWVNNASPAVVISTSPNLINLVAGTYLLTVTDMGSSCTKTATVTITQPLKLVIYDFSRNDLTCYQNHSGSIGVLVRDGTPSYSYSWYKDNGVFGTNTSTISLLDIGTYTVTVTDLNGCTATKSFLIEQPSQLLASETHTAVLCYGGSTGSITVTASQASPPYQYSLDLGTYTGTYTFSTLAFGTHTVTVMDNNGCTVTVSASITQPSVITTTGATQSTIACNGGTATVTINGASGGTGPYSYIFNGSAPQSTNVFPGIHAGTNLPYSVTDAHSCSPATGTITVIEPTVITINTATQTTITCHGGSATVTITATGGTSTLTYSLTGYGSNTNGIFSGVLAGAHAYSVTDVNTCSAATGTITVNEPSVITIGTVTQTTIACNGGSATVTITANGGTGALSYTFDGITNSNGIFSHIAGINLAYSVTDANRCAAATGTFTVVQPSVITTTDASQSTIACHGGTATVTINGATGGTGALAYTFNSVGPQPTNVFTGVLAGTNLFYSVTDANHCTAATGTLTVVQPSVITTTGATQSTIACNGGTATVTINGASGGTGPYSYIFNGSAPQSTNVFPGIHAGTNLPYSVTDAHSCSPATGTITVIEPTVITINTATQTTITCHGGSATVTITATGGTSTLTYSLTGYGSNTNGIFSGVLAGAHAYSVTDVNTCSAATGTITVNEPSVITIGTVTQTTIACNGGSATVTITANGGTGALSYTFDGVTNSNGIFSHHAGINLAYSVTDANNCAAATGTFTVAEPTLLTASISKTDISCHNLNNGSITVIASGGTPSLSYAWMLNGSTYSPTTSTINNLAEGTYTVTVSDARNCQKTASETIINPSDITISFGTQTNVSCFGLANGAITTSASGGTGTLTYRWVKDSSPAVTYSTSPSPVNFIAGNYTLTVTDNNLCPKTATVTITQPLKLVIYDFSRNDLTCYQNHSGSIGVLVRDGTPSYSYSWYKDNGVFGTNTSTISLLDIGTYTVTVTDLNGCTATKSFLIEQPSQLLASETHTAVLCYGGSTGSITVTASQASPPYQYSLDLGTYTGTYTFSTLAFGTHTVTVMDNNGCTVTVSASITQPFQLEAAIGTKTNVSCFGLSDGIVTINASLGTPPYQYMITGGTYTSTNTFGSLAYGSYTVTVKDFNGCTVDVPVSISQPLQLAATEEHSNVSCHGGNNGSISISVTEGTGTFPYQFALNGGTYTSTSTFSSLTYGTKTVTVKDANGCTIDVPVTLTQPDLLTATIVGHDVLCHGGSTGSATLTLGGGTLTPTVYYAWYKDAGYPTTFATTQNLSGLAIGVYTLTVTDGNQCTATATVTIGQPPLLTATATSTLTEICLNEPITLSATSGGGTPTVTFAWAGDEGNGATTPSTVTFTGSTKTFTPLAAGTYTYTVTATDGNACQANHTVSFIVNPLPNPVIWENIQQGSLPAHTACCPFSRVYQDRSPSTDGDPSLYTYQWTVSGGQIVGGGCGNALGTDQCVTILWNCSCTHGWLKLTKTNKLTGCVTTTEEYGVDVTPLPTPVVVGNTNVFSGTATAETYSVQCIPGHLYSWAVVGGTITSGQGSCTITVDWGTTSCTTCQGSVQVVETGSCGSVENILLVNITGPKAISGHVTYDNTIDNTMDNSPIIGTALNGVTIQLVDSLSNVVVATTTTVTEIGGTTDTPTWTAGYFEFTNIPHATYYLRASSTKPWGGVTANDALYIKRHSAVIPGATLTGLALKAGDVNMSGYDNATDALKLQLRLVGLVSSFEATDWVFDITNTSTITYTGTPMVKDIKALATGDVNKSFIPGTAKAIEYTNLQKEGISLVNNSQEFEMPIRVNDVLSLGAVTLELNFNQSLIDVRSITSPLSGFEYKISNGKLMLAWANTTAVKLNANDVLLTLKVKAKDVLTSTAELFSYANTTEFADENGKVLDFSSLKTNSIATDATAYGISVYPNPFKNNAEIDYNVIEGANVKLVIYNAVGQRMEVLVDEYKTAGNYTFNLNTSNFTSGVYSCEIIINGKTSNFQKVIKLVKTK